MGNLCYHCSEIAYGPTSSSALKALISCLKARYPTKMGDITILNVDMDDIQEYQTPAYLLIEHWGLYQINYDFPQGQCQVSLTYHKRFANQLIDNDCCWCR